MPKSKEKVVPIRPGIEIEPEKLSPADKLLRGCIGTGIEDVIILGTDENGDGIAYYQIISEPEYIEGRLHEIMAKAHQSLVSGDWFDEETGPG